MMSSCWIRLSIRDAFFAIHEAEVEHGDVDERNVLWDGTRATVISFGSASYHHELCHPEAPIHGSVAVPLGEYGCGEIWHLLTMLGLWLPGTSSHPSQSLVFVADLPSLGAHAYSQRTFGTAAKRSIQVSHTTRIYWSSMRLRIGRMNRR